MDESGAAGSQPADGQLAAMEQWLRNAPLPFLAGGLLTLIGFLVGVTAGGFVPWVLFLAGAVVTTTSASRHYDIGFLRTVGNEQVIDQWGVLIGGGQDNVADVLENVAARITQTQVPDVGMEQREVAPGMLRGMLGGRRPFLVVSERGRANLQPFRMYINARAYGTNLQVSWYLVQQPGFWQRMRDLIGSIPLLNFFVLPFYLVSRSRRTGESGLLDLDFFDLQDLTAYVTNAHHCLLETVEEVMLALDEDPSRIDRKSRGFLGVS